MHWSTDKDSKTQNYIRFQRGDYGNKMRSWIGMRAFEAEESPPLLTGLMYSGGRGGGADYPEYTTPKCKAEAIILAYHWCLRGADPQKIIFVESPPDRYLTIQGELCRREDGWNFFCSREKMPMRKALAEKSIQLVGLRALLTVKHFCSPSSWDDIETLLEQFPDSVIELSCYSINLGSIAHRNTLIWEVRNY